MMRINIFSPLLPCLVTRGRWPQSKEIPSHKNKNMQHWHFLTHFNRNNKNCHSFGNGKKPISPLFLSSSSKNRLPYSLGFKSNPHGYKIPTPIFYHLYKNFCKTTTSTQPAL